MMNIITKLDLNSLISSFVGILGMLVGILVNEYFKRKDREALFSEAIFQKKLKIYEELFAKMHNASKIGATITDEESLSKEKRHQIWSEVVLDVAGYTDKYELYINEEIAAHCMLTLIGIEDIYYLEKNKKKKEISKFHEGLKEVSNLIKEETGIKRLEKFLKKINEPKIRSSYIEAFKEIKNKYNKK